jgi:hypothetical protein
MGSLLVGLRVDIEGRVRAVGLALLAERVMDG